MDAAPSLIATGELDAWGYTNPRRELVARGFVVRVRPGIYASADEWSRATPELRVVARAEALHSVSSRSPLFSHETAAAIHGLPLHKPHANRVHAIVSDARPGAATGVIRHRGEVRDDEVIRVGVLACTSLERTAADIARTATFEQATVVTDAVLRRLCTPKPFEYDEAKASLVRASILAIARRSAHGVSRAERVLGFADGRAHLPGESISRIRLAELGFRPPRLQVRVPGPDGGDYFVDFEFDDAFGEFDGRIKYVDGRLLVERTADDAFDREKQREDWIRGVTQRRFARWGWSHVTTASALGERLAAFGIRPR